MKKYIYIILLFSISTQAQNLDSLYNVLMSSRGSVKYPIAPSQIEENKQPVKCGFGLAATIKENFNEFSLEKQQQIEAVTERPKLHTSIISPSGFFRIHYDTSGYKIPNYFNGITNTMQLSVESIAIALDSVYNLEINILGYEPPPSDNGDGGDDLYDIYIIDTGRIYGWTEPDLSLGDGKYISYIVLDNDYFGFYTDGIGGARVTAAHEFHHAIQIGSYIYRSSDTYYHEITSTSFEEFVYDDINDYYAYMKNYFNNPSRKFTRFLDSNDGYDLAVWNIFLQERFELEEPMLGHKIIKRSWELMRDKDYRAIIAIANAMQEYGYSFSQKYNEFGDWLYFTNKNTKENEFFEEAANYPLIKSTYTFDLGETEKTLSFESEPTSINFITFTDSTQGFSDTLVAILSNSDVYGTIENNNDLDINFTIANSSFAGANQIDDIYYSKISGESTEYIQSSYIINNELASNANVRTDIDFVYPQPFHYANNNILNIPTYPDLSNTAELNIYSPDMNLVYSGNQKIFSTDNIVVKWDVKDNRGNNLASGVYVYVTKANNKIKKGKFVILN